jgi:hypothetical protein
LCDFTSEDFDMPIKGKMKLFVLVKNLIMTMKLLILPHGEFEIDTQYIYEMIVLSGASKTCSSRHKDGSLQTEA